MEKKNMVLLTVIAVATLLVAVIGATFAFFTATVQDNRSASEDNGKTSLTAGSVASSTIVASVEGSAGHFTATDVYPGHKEVAALSVTADNSDGKTNSSTNIAIKYNITSNTYADDEIKVSIYRKDGSKIDTVSKAEDENGNNNFFGCHHVSDKLNQGDVTPEAEIPEGSMKFYETCEKDESALTGAKIVGKAQTLKTSDRSISFEDKIEASTGSQTQVFYYVVIEFVNKETATDINGQNASMNASLEGNITVEPA